MNFEDDIRQFVLTNLPYDPKFNTELAAKSAQDLLIIFGNWKSRIVSAQPRQVRGSVALLANPLSKDPQYQPVLDQIIAKIETGADLKPHLSRAIRHGYKPNPSGKKRDRQDLDLLLNDWNVHHLHLSTTVQSDGFVERTGPLLFAVFTQDTAYLIDIVDHGGWTREHVIATIINEWPNKGLVWELNGIQPARVPQTEDERKKLRNAHVNSHFYFNNKVYMAAGGLTTAGTSLKNTMSVQDLFRRIKAFEQTIKSDPEYLKKTAERFGSSLPPNPALRFEFFSEGGYGVIETQSGVRFELSS
ncbi:MAG: hypothetical protein NVV83_00190 [Afipia sp.]|nr:hypothetical protein [Afipia sp.]